MISLYNKFPDLIDKIKLVELGEYPSKIIRLENTGIILGIKNLYIKRDNLSIDSFCSDDIRKLEFLLGDAISTGSKEIIGVGYAGSTFTTSLAVHSNKLGLKCWLFLLPQSITPIEKENLKICYSVGARVEICTEPLQIMEKLEEIYWKCNKNRIQSPYFVPFLGNNSIGEIGLFNAAIELAEQIKSEKLPVPDYIYINLKSEGSLSAFTFGLKSGKVKSKVICLSSDKQNISNNIQKPEYLKDLLLPSKQNSMDYTISTDDFEIVNCSNFPENKRVISAMATADMLKKTDRINVDIRCTAYAFSLMLCDIKENRNLNEVFLFWETVCERDFSKESAVNDKQIENRINELVNQYSLIPIVNN